MFPVLNYKMQSTQKPIVIIIFQIMTKALILEKLRWVTEVCV